MEKTKVEKLKKERKYSSLEIANQMYKDAFAVKKQKFALLFPELTEQEIQEKTAAYFRKIAEEER